MKVTYIRYQGVLPEKKPCVIQYKIQAADVNFKVEE